MFRRFLINSTSEISLCTARCTRLSFVVSYSLARIHSLSKVMGSSTADTGMSHCCIGNFRAGVVIKCCY